MAGSEYVTAAGAAKLLGVSTRTITRWLAEGRISSVKIGRTHRIPLAALHTNGNGAGAREWDCTVEFGMDFPGGVVSKNRLWNGGSRRNGMNETAAGWKQAIAESVRYGFISKGARGLTLPLTLEIRCRFVDEGHAVDPQNLVEIVADAVQEGTGLNDRNYTITTYRPEYDPAQPPEVTIRITARCTA